MSEYILIIKQFIYLSIKKDGFLIGSIIFGVGD